MEETKEIVSGFVQNAQSKMPSDGVKDLIPDGITQVITSYTGNYFNNWGTFEWKITEKALLDAMKSAKCGTGFCSVEFEMARMKWQICVYPNGDAPDNEGLFRVLLQPLSFDANWEQILFFRKMEILECGHCCSLVSIKKFGESSEATPVFIVDFQDWDQITVRIEVKVLKIVLHRAPFSLFGKRSSSQSLSKSLEKRASGKAKASSSSTSADHDGNDKVAPYPSKTSFTYHIDERLMTLFKNQKRRGFTHSNEVQDEKWVMYYFPRWNEYITLYLRLVRFPKNCSGLRVNYRFRCEETGDEFVRENVIMTPDHKTQGAINWFEADRLDKTATFHVEVEIMESVGNGTKTMKDIVDDEELTAALFDKQDIQIKRPNGKKLKDKKGGSKWLRKMKMGKSKE